MDSSKLGNGRDSNRVPLHEVVPLAVPFTISIGVSDFCNFKCVYCEHSLPHRQKKDIMISWDDFLYMMNNVEELYEHNNGVKCKNFAICGVGEPLTHKMLPQMVEYISKHEICPRIEITTNGSLLTHEITEKLIQGGLTRLLVSIQGTSSEKYKKVCGYDLDFVKFLDELRYFYSNRGSCKVYMKVVDMALDDEDDKKRFFDIFSPVTDMITVERILNAFDGVDYSQMHKDEGYTRYGFEFKERLVCDSLFMRMNIATNGDVNACACQWPPLVLGNIHQKHLHEIWNGEMHRKYMKLHLQGVKDSIPCCRKCESMSMAGMPMDNLDEHREEILGRLM